MISECSHHYVRDLYRVGRRVVACAFLHLFLVLIFFVSRAAAQAPQTDQERAARAQEDADRKWFVMEDRPSIRVGDFLRLDLTAKLDVNVRTARDLDTRAQMEQRRIGVDGRLFEDVGFQIERELHDDDQPWRDVFVEFRKWRALRVKAGRFKIPFGQERLTSVSDLDFVRRSLASEALTPARDTGVEASGRMFGRALTYMAGVFQHDGDVSRGGTDEPGGRTAAARVIGTPLMWTSSRALQRIEVGVSATTGEVPEGVNGLRARTSDDYVAIEPSYVAGTRVRIGVDAAFVQGPLAFKGEFLQTRDERSRQAIDGGDLPDAIGRGWYVTATSFVIGRLRSNGRPRTPLSRGGIGAIQLGARVESLGFSSHAPGEPALRNPRAANILPNDIRGVTLGVNWFPVRFVKVQYNVIHERLQDPERRPVLDRPGRTSGVFRVQFAL